LYRFAIRLRESVDILREDGKPKNLFTPFPLPQFKRGKSEEDIAKKTLEMSNRFWQVD
jgi:hypothetical protein